MQVPKKLILALVIVSSTLAYFGIAYFTPRTHFWQLMGLVGVSFAGYYYFLRLNLPFKQGFIIATLFRLLFLFAYPRLSDDYFRFIWDGTLLNQGENPYLHLPSFYRQPENATLVAGLTADLYQRLNSPQYYSVYPPVCQALFWIANFLGGKNYLLNCLVWRIFILLAELGTFFYFSRILRLMRFPQRQIWWYSLNPLIIIELTGNLHLEAFLIFFLLGSFYILLRNNLVLSAIFFALAVGVKLWPLLFLPLVWRKVRFKAFLAYGTTVMVLLFALFLPFISGELVNNILNSVNLYFQKFEFNASFYYLSRWLGYRWHGYNEIARIGPLLSLTTLAGILFLTFRGKISAPRLPRHWWALSLFAFTLYLALATVVHPWYITTLVALATCTQWRYPMIWSALAFFSYVTYQTSNYTENLWLVALEYVALYGYLLYEFSTKPTQSYHTLA